MKTQNLVKNTPLLASLHHGSSKQNSVILNNCIVLFRHAFSKNCTGVQCTVYCTVQYVEVNISWWVPIAWHWDMCIISLDCSSQSAKQMSKCPSLLLHSCIVEVVAPRKIGFIKAYVDPWKNCSC